MKRLAAMALAFGAMVVFATPASAATTTLHLDSVYQPAVIKVNGRPVVVNGGYESTKVQVTKGSKVTLEAAATAHDNKFCWWTDSLKNRTRTITITGDEYKDSYTTVYATPWNC